MGKASHVQRTPEQRAALRDAYKLLAAQFDHFLIVCSVDPDHHDTALATDLDVHWKGSWLMANSLADFAKHRITYRQRNNAEPG